MTTMKTLALSSLLAYSGSFVEGQKYTQFPNLDENYRYYSFGEVDIISPLNNVQVIAPTQPYNTDQNSMEVEYYGTFDADLDRYTLWMKMIGKIEVLTSGTKVFMFFGLWDKYEEQWDYLKCSIDFDGSVNANANSRMWQVSDHYSVNTPWTGVNGALEDNIPLDEEQNWFFRDQDSGTECPPLSKCIFTCAAKRYFKTDDADGDYQFKRGRTNVLFDYAVYYGANELTTGYQLYENFIFPLAGVSTISTATFSVVATAVSAYLLF
jgi:hypothetical protein